VTQPTPSLADIRAELDRARTDFHRLVLAASPDDLGRKSNGTDWTNRQLLFHMLFGYLITRNLRVIVTVISRTPDRVHHGFAHALDTTTPVLHKVNYWGSCAGAVLVSPHAPTRGSAGSSPHSTDTWKRSRMTRSGARCGFRPGGTPTSPRE
jgi:hypothetical protein